MSSIPTTIIISVPEEDENKNIQINISMGEEGLSYLHFLYIAMQVKFLMKFQSPLFINEIISIKARQRK